jgi:hypothetical protein
LAARHLHALIQSEPELDAESNRSLLKSLDAALVPSKAKAGCIEALIDGLINAGWSYNWLFHDEYADPSYRRLVEKGFEAVPELIAHWDDDRLTRGREMELCGVGGRTSKQYRVRDLVRDLLRELAGEELKIDRDDPQALDAVRAWWDKARQVREEDYLIDHVFPKKDHSPNEHMLWLLAKKYPQQLPKVYRTLLDERPEMESERVVSALSQSAVSRAEKVDLYVYAGRNKIAKQRLVAILELKDLDHEQFVQLLVETLDRLPKTNETTQPFETWSASFVARTKDKRAWQALSRAAWRADADLRIELLLCANKPERNLNRQERLAFFASFLDDATVRNREIHPRLDVDNPVAPDFPRIEVRNFAAMQLAHLLKIDRRPQPSWDAEQWARFRDEVRAALKR